MNAFYRSSLFLKKFCELLDASTAQLFTQLPRFFCMYYLGDVLFKRTLRAQLSATNG